MQLSAETAADDGDCSEGACIGCSCGELVELLLSGSQLSKDSSSPLSPLDNAAQDE
jgi:hypothetical protein